MKKDSYSCGICGHELDHEPYIAFKKIGSFSECWWLWIIMGLLSFTNFLLALFVYYFLPENYCPICKCNFYKYMIKNGEKRNNSDLNKKTAVFDIVNDYHCDHAEDVTEQIDDLTDDSDLYNFEHMFSLLEKHYENDGNLLGLEKCANDIIKYIESQGFEFTSTQNMITFLSIIFFIVSENDESAMYITYLIAKFLWEEHKNVFKKENNHYIISWKFQTIVCDEDNIFDNLDDDDYKEAYWCYICDETRKTNNCHFLSAFIDEEYGDSVVDNLLDLSLPLSWNPNSFEEFIKINKFNSESSNHDSNYTNYYKILNLDSDATISEIKKAYKDLIAKYHPDVCKETNADKKTIELNKAYEILSDVKLKKEYDEMYF